MNNYKSFILSFACFIHCLLTPFIITIGSLSFFGMGIEPVLGSIIFGFAFIIFILGCKKHKSIIPLSLLTASCLWFALHVKWGDLKYSLISSLILFIGFMINNYLCHKCPKCCNHAKI